MGALLKTQFNSLLCVIRIPRAIKELHNEKSHFDKHLKIIIHKELVIQFYQNQDIFFLK